MESKNIKDESEIRPLYFSFANKENAAFLNIYQFQCSLVFCAVKILV